VDVQGTRNVDAAASADVLLNFELPSDGSAAIFGACVLVGPITNATTGESLDPLPSQSVRREQEGDSDHIIKILKGGVKLNTTFIDDDSR